jgi:FkbM family methyltransferase
MIGPLLCAARAPYRVTRLPAHLRLMTRLARVENPQARRRLSRLAKSLVLRGAQWLAPAAEGTIVLRESGRSARFRAANLHFSYQYQPQHAGLYEMEILALLRALIGRRDVFYDVGSNWGYFTHAIAGRADFAGEVHAFEANPETFADLVSLGRQFGLEARERWHNVGVSERGGGGHVVPGHRMDSATDRIGEAGTGPPIALKPLDEMELPPPAVIKLDVEGHELPALRGAQRLLAAARPYIVLENRAGDPAALAPLQFLAERGYEFFVAAWRVGEVTTLRLEDVADPDRAPLVLVPIDWRNRLLLAEQVLNLFACPQERRARLTEIFSRKT